jgi:hypothetical protein
MYKKYQKCIKNTTNVLKIQKCIENTKNVLKIRKMY